MCVCSGEGSCLRHCNHRTRLTYAQILPHFLSALQVVARRFSAGHCFDLVFLWLRALTGSSLSVGKIQSSQPGLPQSNVSLLPSSTEDRLAKVVCAPVSGVTLSETFPLLQGAVSMSASPIIFPVLLDSKAPSLLNCACVPGSWHVSCMTV